MRTLEGEKPIERGATGLPVLVAKLLERVFKDGQVGSLTIGGNDEERDHAKEDGDTYRGSH